MVVQSTILFFSLRSNNLPKGFETLLKRFAMKLSCEDLNARLQPVRCVSPSLFSSHAAPVPLALA